MTWKGGEDPNGREETRSKDSEEAGSKDGEERRKRVLASISGSRGLNRERR